MSVCVCVCVCLHVSVSACVCVCVCVYLCVSVLEFHCLLSRVHTSIWRNYTIFISLHVYITFYSEKLLMLINLQKNNFVRNPSDRSMSSIVKMFEAENKIDGVCTNRKCSYKDKVSIGRMMMVILLCIVASNSSSKVSVQGV